MGQLKRMDAKTYIHERWASRTWPANMFNLYICTQKKKIKKNKEINKNKKIKSPSG